MIRQPIFLPRPARRGSIPVHLAHRPAPISPKRAGRMMRDAERDARLDVAAEKILRTLLFHWTTWRTGHCAPALSAIARAAKVSRATVCRKIRELVDLGYLQRVRRALQVEAGAGWRGPRRWCQATTAYFFPRISESQGEAPTSDLVDSKTLETRAREGAGVPEIRREAMRESELEAALRRLGERVASREAHRGGIGTLPTRGPDAGSDG